MPPGCRIHELAVLVGYDTVALSFRQKLCSSRTHDGRVNTVLTGRCTASLDVANDGGTGLDTCRRLDPSCHGSGVSDSFSVDDDVMLFAALSVLNDPVDQVLLIAVVALRKENILRAVGNTAPESDISGISSHTR